jgi:streptogramin lyase
MSGAILISMTVWNATGGGPVAHDVFVSYSHKDKLQADAVCAALEATGIRCWIAPRDAVPGEEWGGAIVGAIRSSRVMVLLFSSHADASPQVRREVQIAVSAEAVLIPFRIEDVAPGQTMEFFLGTPHWLDALTPPFEAHLERLVAAVRGFLAVESVAIAAFLPPPPAHLPPPPERPPTPIYTPPRTIEKAPPPAAPSRKRIRWPSRRVKVASLTGGVALVVVVIAFLLMGGQDTAPASPSTPDALPLTGLDGPRSVAVDLVGNVYVADTNNSRLLKLAAGATNPTELPSVGSAWCIAVGADGSVYAAVHDKVLKLSPGAAEPTTLPFTPQDGAPMFTAVAVDGEGSVYAADSGHVFKLPAGATAPTTLPFIGLDGPGGLAIDGGGNIYVSNYRTNEVLKLAPGSPAVRLPFTDLHGAKGIAVDEAGNVYLADWFGDRVLELAAGTIIQTELPFTGLSMPSAVAVDGSGSVYVASFGSNQILKVAPR